MRKITQQAIEAFYKGVDFKKDNTEVTVGNGTVDLYLHGNLIAMLWRHRRQNELEITNAGWQSNTTKERLNGLKGVNICQKKGKWYLNGKEWNGNWITINN